MGQGLGNKMWHGFDTIIFCTTVLQFYVCYSHITLPNNVTQLSKNRTYFYEGTFEDENWVQNEPRETVLSHLQTPENFEDHEDELHHIYKREVAAESNAVNLFTRSGGLVVFHKVNYETLKGSPSAEWLREVVRFHNVLRKLHGSTKLVLDYELSYEAQLWAINLGNRSLKSGKLILEASVQDNNKRIGENIGARKGKTRSELLQLPGSFPVRVWYAEIAKHSWKDNYYQLDSGHFTQVIWNATKRVGCGRVVTEKLCGISGKVILSPFYIVVCKYWPPGNWLHKQAYKDQVNPPKDGKLNKVPNFKNFCPEKSKPCSIPMLCCPEKRTNVNTTNEDSATCDATLKTTPTPALKTFGRSFQRKTMDKVPPLQNNKVSHHKFGRAMEASSYQGLPWPQWHDKRGRHVRH